MVISFLCFCHALRTLITCATINFLVQHDTAFITLNCLFRFCHAPDHSGFLYKRGDGINVVMDKKVEILIMVS